MHPFTILLSSWFLLFGGVQPLAPHHPGRTSCGSQCATSIAELANNLDSSVPLLSSKNADDEQDSSRRLLLASMIGLGLFATVDPAKAAQDQNPGIVFPTTLQSDAYAAEAAAVDWKGIVQKASKKALGGGKAGASAAVVQVCCLMWLRTSMNYQVSISYQTVPTTSS
jgi:hypothetical protein